MFNGAIAADCRPCCSLCALPIRLRQLVNEVIALCTDTLRSARVYQQCNSYRHATGMHTECDGVSTYYAVQWVPLSIIIILDHHTCKYSNHAYYYYYTLLCSYAGSCTCVLLVHMASWVYSGSSKTGSTMINYVLMRLVVVSPQYYYWSSLWISDHHPLILILWLTAWYRVYPWQSMLEWPYTVRDYLPLQCWPPANKNIDGRIDYVALTEKCTVWGGGGGIFWHVLIEYPGLPVEAAHGRSADRSYFLDYVTSWWLFALWRLIDHICFGQSLASHTYYVWEGGGGDIIWYHHWFSSVGCHIHMHYEGMTYWE